MLEQDRKEGMGALGADIPVLLQQSGFNIELSSAPLRFPMQDAQSSTGTELRDPFLCGLKKEINFSSLAS